MLADVWTMDELVERVRVALSAEYPGAPNGRIRDLPDRRAIRWYTTTGLVDRPAGMRGRTALYGRRHLLQLVALKRRQAQGHTLAEIQVELAGATDEALASVARVPEELLVPDGPAPDRLDGALRTRFWTERPDRAAAMPQAGAHAAATPAGAHAVATPQAGSYAAAPPRAGAEVARPRAGAPEVAPLGGVALRGGAILVMPGTPTAADRAAIATAAEPLLDLLADRGLLTNAGRTS
jgi:DNA-binding transcriptional MerR regulator